MKTLHNSFEKQKKQPVHLYSGCCSCCCCLLTPMGNWVADKIVIRISMATNTRWMTLANIVFAILSSIGSWSLLVVMQVVGLGYNQAIANGCGLTMFGFYYYLLFWYSKKWLPEGSNATRVKFTLLQWFLSIIFMTAFFFLSILGTFFVLDLF